MPCNKSVILSDIVIDNVFNFYMIILLRITNKLEIVISYTKILRTWFIVILNTFIWSMNSHEEEAFLIQTFVVIRAQIMESSLPAFNLYSILLTSIIFKSSN